MVKIYVSTVTFLHPTQSHKHDWIFSIWKIFWGWIHLNSRQHDRQKRTFWVLWRHSVESKACKTEQSETFVNAFERGKSCLLRCYEKMKTKLNDFKYELPINNNEKKATRAGPPSCRFWFARMLLFTGHYLCSCSLVGHSRNIIYLTMGNGFSEQPQGSQKVKVSSLYNGVIVLELEQMLNTILWAVYFLDLKSMACVLGASVNTS